MHALLIVGPAVFLLPAMLIVARRVLADPARSAAERTA